jgi:hypothetical protein
MNYPLSLSQQDVLRLEAIAGAEINTLSFSVLFPYHGDEDLLKKAADHVYTRFPGLNTVIVRQQNELLSPDALQVVHPVRFFSSRSEYNCWARKMASSAVYAEVQCADITPVIISAKAEGYHIRLHHAIADGWAASLLLRCLTNAYRDLLSGHVPDGVEIRPHQDFVKKEAAYLSGPRSLRDAEFWKSFLAGDHDGRLFPAGMPGDFSAQHITESLDRQTVVKLKALCAKKGRTFQSVLMSAASIVLEKMENCTDFCLGTILLNRKDSAEQSIFGNCFATVPDHQRGMIRFAGKSRKGKKNFSPFKHLHQPDQIRQIDRSVPVQVCFPFVQHYVPAGNKLS